MRVTLALVLAFIGLCSLTKAEEKEGLQVNKNYRLREGKVLSLFNVVTFANDPCTSTQAGTSGRRQGTCYTTSECQNRNGKAQGNCASGFGVCCVFIVSTTGQTTINNNNTYIQNPGFPGAATDLSGATYTVNKCDPSVCFLRLDFESFTLAGLGSSSEIPVVDVCKDTFTVTVPASPPIPVICGQNTGQHMIIDMGQNPTGSATISVAYDGTVVQDRTYDIKTTQLPCNSQYSPPPNCLQYFTGQTGRMTTFNFIPAAGVDNHLPGQDYAICIRKEEGFCCVEYKVCPDLDPLTDAPFSLSSIPDMMAKQDSLCSLDYVGISGSSGDCNPSTTSGGLQTRYCGTFLNAQLDAIANVPICDCTAPFIVDIHTNDGLTDAGDAATANAKASRGVCLEYVQIPCTG